MYCYSPTWTMASPLQPNLKEIYTYSVYKQNCTLKMTEFCHSLWILFTKCWNLICCAPKIAFRSFGYEKQKRERNMRYKSSPYVYQFLDTNDSLVSPLWIRRHHGLYSFFPSVVEQFVCTEKMDLTKTCSSSLFLLLNFVFGLVYGCMK